MQNSAGDAKKTQEELGILSKSLTSLNGTYAKVNEAFTSIHDSAGDAARTKEQLKVLAQNLESMNKVYGNMLTAMTVK